MEVAGLVLGVVGALPLIIKAAEGYQTLVEIARVKDHMESLGRDLRTELIILRNTYERLLDGIVPAWEVEILHHVKRPSAKWKMYDKQIRLRLRDSYHDFLFRAKAIEAAVQDLQEKLATNTNGEVGIPQMRRWISMAFHLDIFIHHLIFGFVFFLSYWGGNQPPSRSRSPIGLPLFPSSCPRSELEPVLLSKKRITTIPCP